MLQIPFVANHLHFIKACKTHFSKEFGCEQLLPCACAVQTQKTLTTLYPEKKWFTLKDDFLGLCVSFLLL